MPQRTQSINPAAKLRWNTVETSKCELARIIGPVVYFVRTKDDLIKIGHTGNLGRRYPAYGKWDCILAFYRGTTDDETYELERFEAHLVRGREWFRPHADIYAAINNIRESYGLPAVEPW